MGQPRPKRGEVAAEAVGGNPSGDWAGRVGLPYLSRKAFTNRAVSATVMSGK